MKIQIFVYLSLKTINDSVISSTVAAAMGFFNAGETATDQRGSGGVNTYAGAQAMINTIIYSF
ncbi:hypothetical protein [Campylobacter fetus]|uniref:hypothetical protein n=1 Tax=Campylobacter fetus TaxID=196 RepID=UPI0013D813A5|nr:hypothetical protein [Campylobacter fetus]